MITKMGVIKLKFIVVSISVLMGVSIFTTGYPDAGRTLDTGTVDLTKR